MAPRWLQFGDNSNKRASVISVVSNNRRSTYEDPDALVNAFSHPFFDQNSVHDIMENPDRLSSGDRPVSRKRYSLFARNIATPDSDADRQGPEGARTWPRLFQDKTSNLKDTGYVGGGELTRKNSRRSIAPRSTGKHEPILRWMRRVERSSSGRPSTPFGLGSQPEEENEHELKKAAISAPFNFQHVAHTQPRELPELDFVSDQELSLSFWAASAHQTPQADLKGIKAEDIDEAQKRPESALGSRPNSADHDSALSRARSPSLRESASPVLRATRSLSNASAQSRDDSRRPSVISRSASLASLIAEQRSPPTMVHPAFRSASEHAQLMPPMPWMAPSGIQTPTSELNRNLDVVPEEAEGQSPVKQTRPQKQADQDLAEGPVEEERSGSPRDTQYSSFSTRSEGQETNTTSQYDTSVPSLSSGETWEEDIDFCYNMEAESTCDFQWRHGRNHCASPHDSLFASPRKYLADSVYEMSPRASFAQHPANRASANITPMLSSPEFASRWEAGAFENPRVAPEAPDAPLPDINRLSSLFDLPMLQSELARAETSSSTESTSPSTPSAAKHLSSASSISSTKTGPENRLSLRPSSQRSNRLSSQPSLRGSLPSPPPTVPLPPLPTENKRPALAKRATVAGRATVDEHARRPLTADERPLQQSAVRGIESLKSALPVRLRASRSVEGPALRAKMSRSCSSPSVNSLYEAHAIPKAAEKFPVWI
ncbi:hypothetical protein K461DRAFT_293266 [Myriangium duriaei CBS 260.36]|uniref:CRIB domain-containing protein n=1 Tax=Myriangium duriaei CBS 260.36 TaxID=1168546 RepID=A0A9P4IZX9_9PEZI|nr:hypothetical protein K461DRAFT_293266 [Myriangium duriaei CBS 260.36]